VHPATFTPSGLFLWKNLMQKIFLLLPFILLTGCTYSKPVVTEINQNPDRSFTIEKCQIKYQMRSNPTAAD
jgi:hypothetical protein